MTAVSVASLLIALALPGQTTSADAPEGREALDRLKLMKESVKGFTITRADDRESAIRVLAEPAFRLGKQGVGNVFDGAIFLWADATGRPESAMQMFLLKTREEPKGIWLHEFTSLSTRPLTATDRGEIRWRPAQPGLTFRPLDGAPKPGATPAQRLRQMRELAGGFRATDNFGDRGWLALRRLTTPIARYGKAGGAPEDGALFAFVTGTDPEVFLFIEDRPGAAGLEWQYALAPMTCYALKVERDGRQVWTLPRRNSEDPSLTFYDMRFIP